MKLAVSNQADLFLAHYQKSLITLGICPFKSRYGMGRIDLCTVLAHFCCTFDYLSTVALISAQSLYTCIGGISRCHFNMFLFHMKLTSAFAITVVVDKPEKENGFIHCLSCRARME